jgi:hypothetical protein
MQLLQLAYLVQQGGPGVWLLCCLVCMHQEQQHSKQGIAA